MRRRRQFGLVLGVVALLAGAGLPARAQQSLTWTAGAAGGGWYAICAIGGSAQHVHVAGIDPRDRHRARGARGGQGGEC